MVALVVAERRRWLDVGGGVGGGRCVAVGWWVVVGVVVAM